MNKGNKKTTERLNDLERRISVLEEQRKIEDMFPLPFYAMLDSKFRVTLPKNKVRPFVNIGDYVEFNLSNQNISKRWIAEVKTQYRISVSELATQLRLTPGNKYQFEIYHVLYAKI